MSSPSQTGSRRFERLDPPPAEPMLHSSRVDDDRLHQEFFLDWEVPLAPPASDSNYEGRRGSPVDLRGTGALLVGDFDVLTG